MNNLGNKEIMANNIKRQMELNGKTAKEICDALRISPSTFSDWVNGRNYPRIDKIEMLANYFGISKSDLVEEESYYINSGAAEMAQAIFERNDLRILFDATRDLTEEDIAIVTDIVKRLREKEGS